MRFTAIRIAIIIEYTIKQLKWIRKAINVIDLIHVASHKLSNSFSNFQSIGRYYIRPNVR